MRIDLAPMIALISSRCCSNIVPSPMTTCKFPFPAVTTNCASLSRFLSGCSDSEHKLDDKNDNENDNKPILSTDNLDIFHIRRTVRSTQDEAKRLLNRQHHKNTDDEPRYLAVMADNQSHGRGTSGRAWVATQGNLFLTCAIPMEMIPISKMTLLPLGVGLLITRLLDCRLTCRPAVKWPNDVLVQGKKIAGTLIENHRMETGSNWDYWLVGIGVNVESYPTSLPNETKDYRELPRSATSMREYAKSQTSDKAIPNAIELGIALSQGLESWVSNLDELDAAGFITTWKAWCDMDANYELRETGETVHLVDIQVDGRLDVVDADGKQRTLVADYFF